MPDKIIQFAVEKGKYDYELVIIDENGKVRQVECESLSAVLAEVKIKLMSL